MDNITNTIKELYNKLKCDQSTPFDYHAAVTSTANDMWITRTKLFYHMMACLAQMINDDEFRPVVYESSKYIPPTENTDFNASHYKLGIFGSMNANSDIDVGVTYIGKGTNRVADVVKMFEDMSLILLGVSTLRLDIEMYAGMVTIQCPGETNDTLEDRFFVNMIKLGKISEFWVDDMKLVRILTLTSILRSIAIGMKERKEKIELPTTKDLIWERFERFDSLLSSPSNSEIKSNFDKFKDVEVREASDKLVPYIAWLNGGDEKYDEVRGRYYAAVNKASQTIGGIDCSSEPLRKNVIQYITETAESDLWRAESYMMAPTVVHVVRIIQADAAGSDCKYQTTYPIFPTCSQTAMGYMISAFEQMGYIIRFNGNKEKYIDRFVDAVGRMNASVSGGGGAKNVFAIKGGCEMKIRPSRKLKRKRYSVNRRRTNHRKKRRMKYKPRTRRKRRTRHTRRRARK